MIYLTNSFSVHMLEKLKCGDAAEVRIERISWTEAGTILRNGQFRSFFGHKDTVPRLERFLRIHIPVTRELVKIRQGDAVIIATLESTREWEQGQKPGPGFQFYLVTYERRRKQ